MKTQQTAGHGGNATALPDDGAEDRLLLALGEELDRLWEAVSQADETDDHWAEDAALARIKLVASAIACTPAKTADGAAIQLGVLHGMMTQIAPRDPRTMIIHSVVAVLEGLGQRGRDHVGRRRYLGSDPFGNIQQDTAHVAECLA